MRLNTNPTLQKLLSSITPPVDWLRNRPIVSAAIIVVLMFGSIIWLGQNNDKLTDKALAEAKLNLIPVVVAPVQQGTFNRYQFGLGVVTPLNTVEVRSRVDGQLMSIVFEEGQMVKAGDVLAQIDPVPLQVQLELSTGQLVRDKALLGKAQVDLRRYRTLLKQDSISLQLVETKESLVRQYQAAVVAGEGAITSAKLQLEYAKILAPISGRVGFRQVDPGNIVRAADKNGIVTITQLDPISVIFPIPEDSLPRVMALLKTGEPITVDIYDRSLINKITEGRLLAADNQIDATTGTIKLKAEIPNPEDTLFANQFVNVRMAVETRTNATLIPASAIQRGVPGTFVYVVGAEQKVIMTPVKTGPTEGDITVIEEGLSAGTIIVVEGADRLREGIRVKIVEAEIAVRETGGH